MQLYRLYSPSSTDYFYASTRSGADTAINVYGYVEQQSPGSVALTSDDCLACVTLVPVTRLFKPNDHVYTSIDTEVTDFVSMGYGNEGIEFYCASQQNACGASLALHRFLNNGQHFMTTTKSEGMGIYQGIVCYIWPG